MLLNTENGFGVYIYIRISTLASLIAQQKMAELTSTESFQESCYTTRTASMSASTSSALEETQSHESEIEHQGVDLYPTFPARLKKQRSVGGSGKFKSS